jgi:LPXTG-motif cell wall-anchored protein
MKDTLPETVGDYWSKDNVTVTYVARDGSVFKPSDSSNNGWSITTNGSDGVTTQQIVWNDDFSLTIQGVGYIYVTLTFPEKSSDTWQSMAEQLSLTKLTNVWTVGNVSAKVEHMLAIDTVASLQKGVYATGVEVDYTTSGTQYTLSYNNRENAREFYGNGIGNSSGNVGSVVVYYVALYNQGTTNLYVNEIQDVLPKGFRFNGLMYNLNQTKTGTGDVYASMSNEFYSNDYNNSSTLKERFQIMTPDYLTDLTPAKSWSAKGTFQPTVETLSDGRQRVTFKLTSKANSSRDDANFGYDEELGMYYLKPGQFTVIMYSCIIGKSANTEDVAVNSVSMPFYSYNGGDVVAGENIITPGFYNTAGNSDKDGDKNIVNQTPNDGDIQVLDSDGASSLGMNVDKSDSVQWLASQVDITRGIVKPGITKESVDDNGDAVTRALSTDELTWRVTISGGDEGMLEDYTISDTMMAPYKFTGTATYVIDYASASYDPKLVSDKDRVNVDALNMNVSLTFEIPEVGTEKTVAGTSSGYIVRLDEDEDGTQTLTIRLKGDQYDLPPGVKGILTVNTDNLSSSYENKDYINEVYLTPEKEFNRVDVSAGKYTLYDPALDNEDSALPSVTAEARVAVSYGYATTSAISVEELRDGGSTASSNSADNEIVIGSQDSLFRYTLSVNNCGGINSPAAAMNMFVLVDNLPEVDDHQTFYDKFERFSEFAVQFADSKEDLNLQVYVTDGDGNVNVLDASQYDLMFTKQTSFEYSSNSEMWKGGDMSGDGNWFTLEQCLAAGTLGDMRSVRVVIKDANASSSGSTKLMPANATISVAFNAKIDSDSDVDYGDVAYNSFGYLYAVDSSQLQSSTATVGIRTPGVPYLTKNLVNDEGESYKTGRDLDFDFIIYEGANKNLESGLSENEVFAALKELGINATKVTVTVKKDNYVSDTMALANLKRYVYDEDSQTWVPGDEDFAWVDNERYTILELPLDESNGFTFSSVNGSQKNAYTFASVSADPSSISFTNKIATGAIKLEKVDGDTGRGLWGGLFALYSKNPNAIVKYKDAMFEDNLPSERELEREIGADYYEINNIFNNNTGTTTGSVVDSELAEKEIVVDGTTWYLIDVRYTDEGGFINWSGLSEAEYYILELKAPTNYSIGSEPGMLVSTVYNGTKDVTVANYWSYELPYTGGSGTMPYTLLGLALTLASAGALVYVKKKKAEQ